MATRQPRTAYEDRSRPRSWGAPTGRNALEPEVPRGPAVPLDRASVQEIQLELLRRARCGRLDGQRVYDDLVARRDWWEAVLPWRFPASARSNGRGDAREAGGLRHLGALPSNEWRCGALHILAVSDDAARDLAGLGDRWMATAVVTGSDHDPTRPPRLVEIRWEDAP